jgi:hypothetical protein
VAFKTGFALGADLVAFPTLILVANLTHRKCALITCYKELLVLIEPHIIPAYLANLAVHLSQRSLFYDEKERNLIFQ